MFRNRFLIVLSGCLLAASAAWADDVGYIECSSHPDGTQVFGKPRRTPEVVASLACGERFTVLVYGFVFSRVQTSDGKVGYVYSNMIAVDRAAAPLQKPASPQMITASEKVPVRAAPVAQPAPPPPAKPQPAPAQPVATVASVTAAPEPASPAVASPAPASLAPTPSIPEITLHAAPPEPPAPPQPASSQPAAAPASAPVSSAPASPAAASNVPETSAPSAQPDPPAPAQPQPAPAQPAAPAIRPAESRATWERPLPSARTTPRVEVFGGYSFARLDGGAGSSTNLNGAMGSFGWNLKPWLQIVADSSYNFVTISGTKNVLYGNHFGPRYFHRGHNRWGATPFVEALVGGTRADTTITGAGGYTTSANSFSIKVGGGLDLHPSRRWEIRLLDVDYYRTSFGTNVHQNNYWASTGIVLRLFGGAE